MLFNFLPLILTPLIVSASRKLVYYKADPAVTGKSITHGVKFMAFDVLSSYSDKSIPQVKGVALDSNQEVIGAIKTLSRDDAARVMWTVNDMDVDTAGTEFLDTLVAQMQKTAPLSFFGINIACETNIQTCGSTFRRVQTVPTLLNTNTEWWVTILIANNQLSDAQAAFLRQVGVTTPAIGVPRTINFRFLFVISEHPSRLIEIVERAAKTFRAFLDGNGLQDMKVSLTLNMDQFANYNGFIQRLADAMTALKEVDYFAFTREFLNESEMLKSIDTFKEFDD